MNRSSQFAVVAGIVALVSSVVAPAQAQYANEFSTAKVTKQGTSSHGIAGNGIVVVQVQVNADGSHKVIKILRSTNSANNAAALDLAASATYRPAHRGRKAVVSFYDYTLKFTGKSVAAIGDMGALASIRALIRTGKYAGAKTKATAYLAAHPGDNQGQQLLGLADYYGGDNAGAAAAFNGVAKIDKAYRPVAAHAFAGAAVAIAQTDSLTSLSYAQKAYALDGSSNSAFALGIAQLNSGDALGAVGNLKKARDAAFAASTTDKQSKINLDVALMQAYLKLGDVANATTIGNDIKTLDPTSKAPARAIGNSYLSAAVASEQSGDYTGAIPSLDQAAAAGDPDIAVTAYSRAALDLARATKPDYVKVKAYADKAIALKPDDALANYVEAVAMAGQWAYISHKDADKTAAKDYANKALAYAKAANNTQLAGVIDSFIKGSLK